MCLTHGTTRTHGALPSGAGCAAEKDRVTEAFVRQVPALRGCSVVEVIFMHSWVLASVAKSRELSRERAALQS